MRLVSNGRKRRPPIVQLILPPSISMESRTALGRLVFQNSERESQSVHKDLEGSGSKTNHFGDIVCRFLSDSHRTCLAVSVIRFLLKLALIVVSIAVAALVAEFLTRILVLGGPVAAAKSVLAVVPLSRNGLDLAIVADPELGFRYNPNLPNVNSHGIRGPELRLTKQPGQLRAAAPTKAADRTPSR